MSEKWNINVVLCKYCDEEEGTVKEIFNNIKFSKDATPPFYMVTFINGINVGEQLELFYCIDKIDNRPNKIKRARAGKIRLERNGEKAHYPDGSIKKSSVERCCIDMISNRINGIRFPEIGAYELKVYGFTDRVADCNLVIQSEDLLDVSGITFCSIGNKDLVCADVAASGLIIIFCNSTS